MKVYNYRPCWSLFIVQGLCIHAIINNWYSILDVYVFTEKLTTKLHIYAYIQAIINFWLSLLLVKEAVLFRPLGGLQFTTIDDELSYDDWALWQVVDLWKQLILAVGRFNLSVCYAADRQAQGAGTPVAVELWWQPQIVAADTTREFIPRNHGYAYHFTH